MTDLIQRLRQENPVPAEDLSVPEHLLRIPDEGRRRHVPLVAPFAAALALALAALVLSTGGGDGGASLQARAYAATAGPGVLHWRTEQRNIVNGHLQEHTRLEGWGRGDVRHIVLSRVRAGRATPRIETRIDSTSIQSLDIRSGDRFRAPAPRQKPGRSRSPLGTGSDPLAAFRQAYRDGRLKPLGGHRYAVPLGRRGPVAVYELDPATALPRSLTLTSRTEEGGRTYRIRFVMTFAVYERLPDAPQNRALLRMSQRPRRTPGTQPAAAEFRVLREGPGLSLAQQFRMRRLATGNSRMRLSMSGARRARNGFVIIPGRGYVCLARITGSGYGATCGTIAGTRQSGLGASSSSPGPGGKIIRRPTTVLVPDGVRALKISIRGGRTATIPVLNNLATFTGQAYAWQLLR